MIDLKRYILGQLKSGEIAKQQAIDWVQQLSSPLTQDGSERLSPLLQRNCSDLYEQRFSSVFSGDEFFLADHRVNGEAILPGVAYLEMARRAAIESLDIDKSDHWRIGFANVVFSAPIIVGEQPLTVYLAVVESSDEDRLEFEIFSLADAKECIHCQGSIQYARHTERLQPRIDLAGLQQSDNRVEPADFYRVFEAMGIEYGPAHRPVVDIQIAGNAEPMVLAELQLPEPLAPDRDDYGFHPSLMDGALQASIALDLKRHTEVAKPVVPFAVDSIECFAELPLDKALVVARYSEQQSDDDSVDLLDFDVCDSQGNVCVSMSGFCSRRLVQGTVVSESVATVPEAGDEPVASRAKPSAVRAETTSKGSGELTGELLLVPRWDRLTDHSRLQSQSEGWLSSDKQVLVIGGSKRQRKLLQGLAARVSFFKPNYRSNIDDLASKLQKFGRFDHIFWLLPLSPKAEVGAEAMLAAQQEGVVFGFRLIKALLQLQLDARSLGVTVITQQTVAISGSDSVHPAHASVYGLMSSLIKEYPQWSLRLLDLAIGENWPMEDLVSLPGQAEERVYRRGVWYQQALINAELASPAVPVYRREGVYLVLGGAGGLGEIFSEYLIRHYRAQVVWVGRRAEDAVITAKCDKLAALGPRPVYFSADAADVAQLQSVYADICRRFGKVDGLVHSALVLKDQGLASMDESSFRASLAAKVDLAVNIGQVFAQEKLDFVLFFSSLQSSFRAPGQSNYAAGCTFVDAYAQALDRYLDCPVKVINWGYWGSVGIVASDSYRARMQTLGIASIEPEQGLPLLEKLLAGNLERLALLQTDKPHVARELGVDVSEKLYVDSSTAVIATSESLPSAASLTSLLTAEKSNHVASLNVAAFEAANHQLHHLLAQLLYRQLTDLALFEDDLIDCRNLGFYQALPKTYQLWLQQSFKLLAEQGLLEQVDGGYRKIDTYLGDEQDLWAHWQSYKASLAADKNQGQEQPYQGFSAKLDLVEVTLKSLSDILTAKISAPAVLFPSGSMSLVEGLYQHNQISDYFNQCLARALVLIIKQRLAEQPNKKLRLLEIGAGTGGTSRVIFEALQDYTESIENYCYTDISKAFLLHGEREFSERASYLTTRLFDVSQPLAEQGFKHAEYDFVIATNVLHASSNISQTLRNVKALLNPRGNLLLNEAVSSNLFLHLTFGLLDGWWLTEDSPHRLPGSPILTSASWQALLALEGFKDSVLVTAGQEGLEQQIIVAATDGVIRQVEAEAQSSAGQKSLAATLDDSHNQSLQAPKDLERINRVEIRSTQEQVTLLGDYIRQLLASVLNIDVESIIDSESFSAYGVDSILIVQLTRALRQEFADISSALLFECTSVEALVAHLHAQYPAQVDQLFSSLVDSDTDADEPQQVAGYAPVSVDNTTTAANSSGADIDALQSVTDQLCVLVAEALHICVEDIDTEASLDSYGVDSILIVKITRLLRQAFGDISSSLLFEYNSIASLAQYLLQAKPDLQRQAADSVKTEAVNTCQAQAGRTAQEQSLAQLPQARRTSLRKGRRPLSQADAETVKFGSGKDVAIIGLNGRYAQADNLQEFWQNLSTSKNCISEVPAMRWDWRQHYGENKGEIGKIYSKWGGFIRDIDAFDPLFFNISPREAETMDPQERLFLQCAYHTLEDAGYTPKSLAVNKQVGVFVGVMNSTYQRQSTHWSVANRVSYLFDFNGPSFSVDTACSSSLTAIHLAWESVSQGRCDLAIAGGVNLIVDPVHYLGLTDMSMLSGGDQCRSFGAGADGFVDGEGLGAVLLKPLARAEADGDHIYGVIKGSAINHGGRTNGYTVPSPAAQAEVVGRALLEAGVEPQQLSYIEAHGTGTSLGDPIEIAGLTKVFGAQPDQFQHCAIGSAKSNIGHCESAAGIAGLTKILLQLQHRQLVPSLHSEELNPEIDFSRTPFKVQQQLSPWNTLETQSLRTAGVSSFGAGGSNAHLIVQQYLADSSIAPVVDDQFLILLSAKNEQRLQDRIIQLRDFVKRETSCVDGRQLDMAGLAYTLQVGREHMAARLGFVVASPAQLLSALDDLLIVDQTSESGRFYRATVADNHSVWARQTSDEDFSALLDSWLRKRKYEKLLDLWIAGLAIDWSHLYRENNHRPQKISLPGYPFAKESYWQPHKFSITPLLSSQTTDCLAAGRSIPATAADSQAVNSIDADSSVLAGVSAEQQAAEVLCFSEDWQSCEASSGRIDNSLARGHVFFSSAVEANKALAETFDGAKFISPQQLQGCVTQAQKLQIIADIFSASVNGSGEVLVGYLWPLEDRSLIENCLPILDIIHAIKQSGCSRGRIILVAAGSTAVELAHIESWLGIERSIKMLLADVKLSVLFEDESARTQGTSVDYEFWAQRLETEFSQEQAVSVCYRQGLRHVSRVGSLALQSNISQTNASQAKDAIAATVCLKEEGTYLITGGCGGLGYLFAQYLAEHYRAKLILVGRSTLDPQRQDQLQQLQNLGAEVLYVCADVADDVSMGAVISQAGTRFGVIDGVIHSAGTEDGKGLFDKTQAEFQQLLRAKVAGTLLLDELLADQPLDFVCYFSSLSAILGDTGACDYAMANRFQLAYARLREQRREQGEVQGKSLALAWPLWAEGGMTIGEQEQTQLYLRSSGQQALDNQDGLALFSRCLNEPEASVIVVKGQPSRVNNFLGVAVDAVTAQPVTVQAAAGQPVVRVSGRPELKGLSILQSVIWDLKAYTSELLKIDREKLALQMNLSDFGFDSIRLAQFSQKLSVHFSIQLTPSVFFSHPTLQALALHLQDKYTAEIESCYQSAVYQSSGEELDALANEADIEPLTADKKSTGVERLAAVTPVTGIDNLIVTAEPQSVDADSRAVAEDSELECIAIVGMSGRFPGARTVAELWNILAEGGDSVTEIPAERFDWRDYYGDPIKQPGKTNGKWLGAMPGIKEFDCRFFEISPAEAELMDPRQRLLLQEAWRALEDAGYGDEQLSRQAIGMFVGVEQGDYHDLIDAGHSLTGGHDGILAARLAYALNLQGPALAINTACSSGLVAAHQACQSLRAGDCDAAIAAGVNLLLLPDSYVAMGKAGMLSADGKCHAFSQDANGMVPAEAIVAVVLKPLSRAEAAGDPIHAVIRASGINYDGKTNGITAPSGAAQARLLRDTYQRHQIAPQDIDYIVTHGTGTRLGDPVEINALYDVFNQAEGVTPNSCALTSTKSNLGHSFAASGLVSLVSLVEAMRHQTIPASLHCQQESDYIPWADSPFYVNKQARPWPRSQTPRLGAVSAFGMSGTNAHMVLASYERVSVSSAATAAYRLLVVSAKTEQALVARIDELCDLLQSRQWTQQQLDQMSLTLLTGRQHFSHRCAIVAQDSDDAMYLWRQTTKRETLPNLFRGEVGRDFSQQKALAQYGEQLLLDCCQASELSQQQESLYALADLYCQGYRLSWSQLFAGKSLSRLHLPAYPFAREEYWGKASSSKGSIQLNDTQIVSGQTLSPVLHRNSSTLLEQQYTSTFTGDEFFLADHIVKGQRVLPGVVYIEMARRAVIDAMVLSEQLVTVEVENIVFAQPLTVASQAVDVHITLQAETPELISFEVYTQTTAEENEPRELVHAQGKVKISATKERPAKLDLENLQKQCSQSITADSCYDVFTNMGLEYGPGHRGLSHLQAGRSSDEVRLALGELRLPQALEADAAGYDLHPSLLDCALQASIGLVLNADTPLTQPILPFAIGRVCLFSPVPQHAWVVVRSTTPESGKVQKCDLDIVDGAGNVCLTINEFASRRLADTVTSDAAQMLLLQPRWLESRLLNDNAEPLEPGLNHQLVIAEGDNLLLESLQRQIPNADIFCLSSNAENLAQRYTDYAEQLLSCVQLMCSSTTATERPNTSIQLQLLLPEKSTVPALQGLSGLLKSASQENSKLRAQTVSLDFNLAVKEIASHLIAELNTEAVDVRYRDDLREVSTMVTVSNLGQATEPSWKNNGVYLISGGLGGLAAIVAESIVTEVDRATIFLVGRSELSADRYDYLQQLNAIKLGQVKINYQSIDVSNRSQLDALLNSVRAEHGSLTGVIHCAGIVKDSVIQKKSVADLRSVFAPKVAGIVALDEATRADKLEFFVAFSSISSVFGNLGQSDYAAANGFMDSYIAYRCQQVELNLAKGKSLSINWPLWADGGMQLDGASLERLRHRTGMQPLTREQGLLALAQGLSSNGSQLAVLFGDHDKLLAQFVNAAPSKQISAELAATEQMSIVVDGPEETATGVAEIEVSAQLVSQVQVALIDVICEQLKVKRDDIDIDAEFSEFGFDSVSLTLFGNSLNQRYELELAPTIFFEYPTIVSFADYLIAEQPSALAKYFSVLPSVKISQPVKQAVASSASETVSLARQTRRPRRFNAANEQAALPNPEKEAIAVIGMSGCFPKAQDLDEFWQNLQDGRDCITEIPDSRWDWSSLYGDPQTEINKTNIKFAGLIEGLEEFDPLFFGISPREAEVMDPQQRLLMTYVWKVIEDAGYAPEALNDSNTGLFIGTGNSGYSNLLSQAGVPVEGHSTAGLASSIGPNRMSFLLNLHGPSEPVETACSSALVAVHRGIQVLRSGQCDLVIVGGVNTLVSPEPHIGFSKAGMLSPEGRCKTFSSDANGYVRGEGVGILMLKPLSAAEAAGDNIYGLILGSAENHGGRANSLTAPNPRAQAELIKTALRDAAVEPASVSYIEAHGTGTSLGDPIEFQGLQSAFQELASENGQQLASNYCALGAVKTNIGHLELAAGAAGMIKVLLQLKHRQLVPSLHCDRVNDYIDIDDSPFQLLDQAKPWAALQDQSGRELPRRAGVSSFGFGGVNAHIVLEEYVASESVPEVVASSNPVVVVLSAKNEPRLQDRVVQLLEFLERKTIDLPRLAYSLQVGREAMASRFACLVASVDELKSRLASYLENPENNIDFYRGEAKNNRQYLALFSQDEELQQAVSRWAERKKFDRIAELWVKGLEFDWSSLYGDNTPGRISLPSYPFAKERYWVPAVTLNSFDGCVEHSTQSASHDAIDCVNRPAAEANAAVTTGVLRFAEQWQVADLDTGRTQFRPTRLICLLSSSSGQLALTEALTQALPQLELIFVAQASSDQDVNSVVNYQIDRLDASSYLTVFNQIAKDFTEVDGLCYLWPLEDSRLISGYDALIDLLKAMSSTSLLCPRLLLAGQAGSEVEQAYLESWIGIERSLGLVLADSKMSVVIERCTCVSSPINLATWGQYLAAEICQWDANVLYLDGARYVNRIEEVSLAEAETPLRQQGTYLITGASGGLGRLFAEYLAANYQAKLVLVARSGMDSRKQLFIDGLLAKGAQVLYIQADVADRKTMAMAIEQACQRFGVIDGVLHAAGLAGEETLVNKSYAQFSQTLAPKVSGTLTLDELLAEQPLDFVCYFSSTSAILGDFGGCDYAVANRFLMSYARLREQRRERGEVQGKTIAIGWPLWEKGGMQARTADETEFYLRASGQLALTNQEGISEFEALLAHAASQTFIMQGLEDSIRRLLGLQVDQFSSISDQTAEKNTDDGSASIAGINNTGMSDEGHRGEEACSPGRVELNGLTLAECVAWDLKQLASGQLKIARELLDADENLADFGFDSISLADFSRVLNGHYAIDLTPAVFYSHPSLCRLQAFLLSEYPQQIQQQYLPVEDTAVVQDRQLIDNAVLLNRHEIEASSATLTIEPDSEIYDHEAIAIIGMSGRFPGARNVDDFWQLLLEGRDVVEEIPLDRFDWRDCYAGPQNQQGKSNSKWLAALPGVKEFDPLFFEISPADAETMDPRQRLLLQESWRALENAGYADEQLARNRIGMFVGVEQGDYQNLVGNQGSLTGNHDGILAARLAYMLDLKGPVKAINTACSSGLVAVHDACQSLRLNDCDTAIAAAVNLILTPDGYVAMGQAGMLSPDGQSHVFCKQANGLVPGEAVVSVVLKRLSLALAEGDAVQAVIRGSGVNYDGKTNGITAPSGAAQSKLLQDIYDRHNIQPRDIDYIVAHGTGTRLGDPIEINALNDVFKADKALEPQSCALTSTKANVGHCFAASGLVSLVSLVKAMQQETIPASLHCREQSDYITWATSPFYVNKSAKAWPRQDRARLGGVSAFGMSGTNAHLVVESYDDHSATTERESFYYLLAVSAKSEAALAQRVEDLALSLSAKSWQAGELRAMSFTLLLGRQHFAHRCALVVEDRDDAIYLLGKFHSQESRTNLFKGRVARGFTAQPLLASYGNELAAALDSESDKKVYRQKACALADLYCQGYNLQWKRIFANHLPRPIGLPGYPFAREHYWIAKSKSVTESSRINSLSPLLHTNCSTLTELRFSANFEGHEFFLADHIVAGNRVLPGVAYLEMARVAVTEALSLSGKQQFAVRLENIIFSQPLVMDSEPVQLQLSLLTEAGEITGFEIYSLSSTMGSPEEELLHAQGRISLAEQSAAETTDLEQLFARCDQVLAADRCYQVFADMGLNYGDSFQGLKEVYFGQDVGGQPFVVAQLQLPPALCADMASYGLHPSLVDSALQASIGLLLNSAETADKPALPFAIESVALLTHLPEQVFAIVRPSSDSSDRVQKCDVELVDAQANLCLRILGFSSRKQAKTVVTPAASEADAAILLLTPVWQLTDTLTSAVNPAVDELESDRRCLVFCDFPRDFLPQQMGTGQPRCLYLEKQGDDAAENFTAYASQLLAYMQTLVADNSRDDCRVQLLLADTADSPLYKALMSLLRCITQEHPGIASQLLLVQDDYGFEQLVALAKQEACQPDELVRYSVLGREVMVLEETFVTGQGDAPVIWRDAGVYLISGGAGGLGLIFSELLARSGLAATLILIGRSTLTADRQLALDKLRNLNNQLVINYQCLDVSDSDALTDLIEYSVARYGALRGIIHSAGVLDDGFLVNKSEAQLRQVFVSKVGGIVALDSASRHQPLDWFVACSSISALFGNLGQLDYAAANGFMDGYMVERQQRVAAGSCSGRSLSINWPLWQAGGMQVDEAVQQRLARAAAMWPLPNEQGGEAFLAALSTDCQQLAVLYGQPDKLREKLASKGLIAMAVDEPRDQQTSSQLSQSIRTALAPLNKSAEQAKLQQQLAEQISQQLKVELADIDVDAEFSEFGFDSVSLTLFANNLNTRYQLELLPTIFFEYPTIAALVDQLSLLLDLPAADNIAESPIQAAVPASVSEAVSVVVTDQSVLVNQPELNGKLQAALLTCISQQLQVEPQDIELDAEFSEFGFDSISLTTFANELNQRYGLELSPTVFFEFPTLAALSDHLLVEYESIIGPYFTAIDSAAPSKLAAVLSRPVADKTQRLASRQRSLAERSSSVAASVSPSAALQPMATEAIAIVGVSGCFPGAADLEEFWQNLAAGKDSVTEVPASRWDWQSLYGDPVTEANKTNIKHAGVIEIIDRFDPLFFGISPREAEVMDPQQRLLMTYVWKVIEDAGYSPQALSGSNTGLYIGTGNSGYGNLLSQAGVEVQGYSTAGLASSIGPNRMSFLLNLHGPSEPIETACSSALVAVHRGVQALRSGQCEAAIVGGVNTLVTPEPHISFSKAGMLSRDGKCKTFSEDANGYVRGEGVGMLMLKPLSVAEANHDQIYGLILGSAENHGGRANSLTAPNPKAQAALIKSALSGAGIDPASIGCIEAHGTGTPLGDPIEVQGLKAAFGELAAEQGKALASNYCALGSVKTNIGHLELAAGIAGIIKVLLQMKHRQLVPSLHCDQLNPYIDIADSPFHLVKQLQPWPLLQDEQGRDLPRRAGVSSFGFGGVNAHVVLQEYVPAVRQPAVGTDSLAIVLSAKTPERLQQQAQQLLDFSRTADVDLRDLAYSLQVGREAMAVRLACRVTSMTQLQEKLQAYVAGEKSIPELFVGKLRDNKETLSLFTMDEDLQQAVSAWVAKGKLDKLLALWVKGLALDWSLLYSAEKPYKISLPGYPFAEESFWVPSAANTLQSASVTRSVKPRLTEVTQSSTLDSSVNAVLDNNKSFDGDFYLQLFNGLRDKTLTVDQALLQTSKSKVRTSKASK